jgi:TatD DNase family protein
MFDSHCHLDDEAYDADRREVIARARAAGVQGIIVPGFEPDEWPRLAPTCALDPMIRCAVGLHPWYVHTLDEARLAQALEELPSWLQTSGAVAVGECGLDGGKAKGDGAPLFLQKRVLEVHLDAAERMNLPVILHCFDAHAAMLELLESRARLPRGGVMHSYSGSAELVTRYARLGMRFSFAGILTRENAKRPRRALCAVPLELLLLESDGPDQAASGLPTRRSEPAHLPLVLAAAARARAEPASVLERALVDNARKLFAI